jgi:geranylgeranyl reductase family protein
MGWRMDATDVVVVGAGPAGSAAAYFLAAGGINVTVVDKSKFPRDKTCGDGVGPRAVAMLEKMGLLEWVSSGSYYRCDKVRLFASSGDYFEATIPSEDAEFTNFYITPRHELDLKLIETAVSAGATFLSESKATSIIRSDGFPTAVRIKSSDREKEIQCKVVVCADGTYGTFAKFTEIERSRPQSFAIRAYYSNIKGLDDCINIVIDKQIPEGYAWVFPTSTSTANIGLGINDYVLKKNNLSVREMLKRFIKEGDIGPVDIREAVLESEIKGAYLRMGNGKHPVVADGIILIGDAASLVSPLSGEGIAYALESGELAAQTILGALDKRDVSAASLKHYQRYLNEHYFKEHIICHTLRRSFSFSSYALFDMMVRKGIRHVNLAEKFTSVISSTAHPASILSPRYLRYYI